MIEIVIIIMAKVLVLMMHCIADAFSFVCRIESDSFLLLLRFIFVVCCCLLFANKNEFHAFMHIASVCVCLDSCNIQPGHTRGAHTMYPFVSH